MSRLAAAMLRSVVPALAAAVLATGCAQGGRAGYDPPGEPARRPPPSPVEDRAGDPHDSDLDRAYDDGYSRGWGDREQGRSPEHDRWAADYGAADEPSFRTGYADGYQRRPHRYGAAAPDVTPVAPDWLVGEWSGYDEREDVEVVLQVRRDGGVTLVGGGRPQPGAWRNGRLELRQGVWRVERVRGAIVIAPEQDPGAAVRLMRR